MAEHLFGMTDTGKLRTNNEDVFLTQELMDGQYLLAGVIDGVGGYEGGEVAAALAKDVILAEMNEIGREVITQMKITFTLANEEIASRKLMDQKLSDMACVATLAVIDRKNNLFHYVHVGDTRLYLFRDNSLVKISHDQSFVGFLEDSGRLTEDAAMLHPKRNEINQALGLSSSEELSESYFETGSSPFLPGDQLLLCSDGLTDLVLKDEISAVLKEKNSLVHKASELISKANEAGGKDNITVVLVKHDKEPVQHEATQPAETLSVQAEQQDAPGTSGSAPEAAGVRASRPHLTGIATDDPVDQAYGTATDLDILAAENIYRDNIKAAGYGLKEPVTVSNEINTAKLKTGKTIVTALSVLCGILAILSIWLSYKYLTKEPPLPAPVAIIPMNPQEQVIQDSVINFKGDTLKLSADAFKGLVRINKPITIDRDSLLITVKGDLVLQRDTAYNGPAIVLAPNCKYVRLSNMVFDGFDTAIISYQNVMELKNVRFTHTKNAIQQRFVFPEGQFINGRKNYQADSLAKK
jgi:serine/threonine protein phosphatase PrpC